MISLVSYCTRLMHTKIEELEKKKLYEAVHTRAERQEKWARVVYEVKIQGRWGEI